MNVIVNVNAHKAKEYVRLAQDCYMIAFVLDYCKWHHVLGSPNGEVEIYRRPFPAAVRVAVCPPSAARLRSGLDWMGLDRRCQAWTDLAWPAGEVTPRGPLQTEDVRWRRYIGGRLRVS